MREKRGVVAIMQTDGFFLVINYANFFTRAEFYFDAILQHCFRIISAIISTAVQVLDIYAVC